MAKKTQTLAIIGAGRGADKMQPEVAEYNRQSQHFDLRQILVDSAPGKAMVLAAKGDKLGVESLALEATGESFLEAHEASPTVVSIDDAHGIARILRMDVDRVIFIYSIVQLPFQGITGWMFVFTPQDRHLKGRFADFFAKLAQVLSPSGANKVFGAEGPAMNRLIEDLYRKRFAEHFSKNLRKVVAQLEPESPSAEMTLDGVRVSRVLVLDQTPQWRSFEEVIQDLRALLREPAEPGTDFMVFETADDQIRIHKVRYRVTDRQFSVDGVTSIDSQSYAEWEEALRRREISRTNAAIMTD